jgi:hypothetical protein
MQATHYRYLKLTVYYFKEIYKNKKHINIKKINLK